VRKDKVFLPHDLTFLLIKSKKYYKAKFSTNLILKKKSTKIILEGKKTHEEKHCSNWQYFVGKTTVFAPIQSTKIISERIIKKNHLEKSTVFCKKTTTLSPVWFSFIVIIIFNQLNIKKKSTKIILKKIIKKIMRKHRNNSQCFKERKLQS
jgi:hypothetical protein